jgi:hypothetical protein
MKCAEREKLSGELDELEIAERVLAQFGGKAATTGKRRRVRPAKTTPSVAAEGRGRSERKAPGISISDASLKVVRAHSEGATPAGPRTLLPHEPQGPGRSPSRKDKDNCEQRGDRRQVPKHLHCLMLLSSVE